MTSIYPYQTREVRDLAWACFSSSLLLTPHLDGGASGADNCRPELTAARQAWLQDLDRDAAPLLEHLLERPSHRLGVYFEQLWHFFLQRDPDVELVARNLPVHEGGRTLGEFDCIYYCLRRRRHVHLELAVKFYLGHRRYEDDDQPGRLRDWLGPNTADRLDRKVQHLMQRQIRLADQPAAAEQVQALAIGPLLREVEIKGYLFQDWANPLPPPPAINPQSSLHSWCRIGQLAGFLARRPVRSYLPLPRLRWLSPAQLPAGDSRLDDGQLLARLAEQFERGQPPQLIAALDDSGAEVQRFFVTDNDWPGTDAGGGRLDRPAGIQGPAD